MKPYQSSHLHCKEVTRFHAKSFYFASHVLPKNKQKAAYSVYAFCRFADDGIDKATSLSEHKKHLEVCTQILDRVYGHKVNDFVYPFEWALEQTIAAYDIRRYLFEDLLTGMIMDTYFKPPEDSEELLKYCYHVAGCVGLMMTQIFETKRPAMKEAESLGIAMQLTNIARDIREDALMGRVYLPQGWLRQVGLNSQDIFDFAKNPTDTSLATRIWQLEMALLDLAEEHYVKASQGISLITADGSQMAVKLMASVYRGILTKIKSTGIQALITRTRLSFFEKLLYIPKLILNPKLQIA